MAGLVKDAEAAFKVKEYDKALELYTKASGPLR
jgi:hypothetical protein